MNLLVIFLTAVTGSQLTHQLIARTNWGAIRASAMGSLLFIGATELLPFEGRDVLRAAFLGSSFLGMSSSELFSPRDLIFASVVFSLLFHFVLPFNIGLGGALGTAAFTSCFIVRCCHWMIQKIKV